MHDYDLLSKIFEDKKSFRLKAFQWAIGLALAFGFALLFAFLMLRGMEIEGRYHWQWDAEQQRYFKTERGV